MRPHKLILQAFGSFKNKTVIDFDKLGSSLYLITGQTGSGKTTIFDGLCVALFGKASGSDRSGNKAEYLYSNYCRAEAKKPEMQVILHFSHDGKMYMVERVGRWGKKGTASNISFSSKLSCDDWDKDIVSDKDMQSAKTNNVTAKIEEILSININQFRQIIMLSQGEFSKFIKAGTSEKNEILGRICDNTQYKDFEKRLHSVKLNLEAKENDLIYAINTQLDSFENKENYSCTDEYLLKALALEIKENEEQLKKLAQEIEKINDEKSVNNNKKINAEYGNKLLDVLKLQEDKKSKLENKKTAMEQLQSEITVWKKLLLVMASDRNLKNSIQAHKGTVAKIENQKRIIKDTEAALDKAVKVENEKNSLLPEAEDLQTKVSNLQKILPEYDLCNAAQVEASNAERKCRKLTDNRQNAENDIKQAENELSIENEIIDKLKDAGDSNVKLWESRQNELLDKQRKINVLSRNVQIIIEKEANLDILNKDGRLANEKCDKARARYEQLYTAFCAGQAALLSEDLYKKIQSDGKAICPVCGTVHDQSSMSRISQHGGTVPTQNDVDKAKKVCDEAEIVLQKKRDKYKDILSECGNDANNFAKETESILGIRYEWKTFKENSDKTVAEWKKSVADELKDIKKELSRAINDRDKLNAARAEVEKLNKQLKVFRENLQQLIKSEEKAKEFLGQKQNALAVCMAKLEGHPVDKSVAEREIKLLNDRIAYIKNQIDNALNNRKKLENSLHEFSGQLKGLEDNEKKQAEDVIKAEKEFSHMLEKYNFADEAEYRQAYIIDGKAQSRDYIEAYIEEKETELNSYNNDVIKCDAELEKCRKDAEGIYYVDLSIFNNNIQQLNDELKEANKYRDSVNSSYSAKKKAYNRIETKKNEYNRVHKVIKTVIELDDMLYNKNHKLSVYVLDSYFRQILDFANKHINTMSRGRFNFIPKSQLSDTGAMDLDFKLEDMDNNEIIGVESLSGGEKFEVALSMALGLSDLAQMQGGGQINIESMFIDEGFGSLGTEDLNRAADVLNSLAKDNRQIGIISHVRELEENIPHRINVIKNNKDGSMIEI